MVASRVGQERRHGVSGSQDSIDHPRLTADFSGEPAVMIAMKGSGKLRNVKPSSGRL